MSINKKPHFVLYNSFKERLFMTRILYSREDLRNCLLTSLLSPFLSGKRLVTIPAQSWSSPRDEMFGKKEEKGPTIEQIVASLELKMNVVELLLERNEESLSERFDSLYEKIDHEAKQNERNLSELSGNIQILATELQRLRSGLFEILKEHDLYKSWF